MLAPAPPVRFLYVDSGELVAHARALFREYQAEIGVDLCFQGFEEELARLPGDYAPPGGRLIVALHGAELAGCVALRRLDERVGEMKRLYVRPPFRGKGIGRELARTILDDARLIGYRAVRLDTLPSMQQAIALYRALGFRDVAPYYPNPIAGAVYLERTLVSTEG